tara:strand:- start:39 stop:2594 length:2556 start_codon:yes stop_codon:yes gene_type:complete
MARIRYQPATKTKGFQPIQLTKDGISRMREETNRVVQGMEKNLQAEQRQRKENLQAMQDNAAYTKQITKENRAIEVQNLKNEQLSITQTAARDQQQAKYDADATETILSSLVDFSTTIQKTAAKRTAKQLEDQTDYAAARDTSSFSNQASLDWDKNWGALYPGAMQNSDLILEQGVLGGEEAHETWKKLSQEPGSGALSNKITVNNLTVETRNIFYNKAITGTEKMYPDGRGGFFSGLEAAQDPDKHRALQQIIRQQTVGYIRNATKYTDPNALQDAFAEINKQEKLEDGRVQTASVAVAKDSMRQQAAVLYSGKNPNDLATGYSKIKIVDGFKAANTSAFNALVATNDDAKVAAFAAMPMPDGNTLSTSPFTKDGYAQAVVRRDDRINARNRETKRVAKEEYRSLRDNNADYLEEEIRKNPHKTWNEIANADAANDVTSSKRLKRSYDSAIKGLADQESALLDSKILSRTLDVTFVNSIEDSNNRTRAKEAFKQLQEQELGGELGVGIVSGFNQTAKKQTDINAPMGTQQTYLFEARMLNEYKAHFKKHGDALAANQYVQDLITAGNNDDKNSPFYKENRGTSMYYPNLETPDKDKAKRRQDINKAVLENGIGVVDMPEALATTQEMDASYLSFSRNSVGQYPAGILQTAELTGRTPSEVFNAHRKANNKKYGTNKPLITPTLITDVIDKSNLRVRKLLTSGNAMHKKQAAAELSGTTNMPGNIRSSMIGPTGALTYEANKQAYVNIGTAMQSAGFQIGEHSAFDQVDPVHAGNSYHNYDEAFDVTHQTGDYNTSIAKTKQLKELIRSMNIFKEVIGPGDGDPNHATHLHLGGLIRPITQEELDLINSIN